MKRGMMHQAEPGPVEPLPITEDPPLRSARTLYTRDTLKMDDGKHLHVG
jgi:hypothetical protein